MSRSEIILAIAETFELIEIHHQEVQRVMAKASFENPWFTIQNCEDALNYWKGMLSIDGLSNFSKPYTLNGKAKNVGIVMAGNIPLVGFHDLLVCLLSGHCAVVKMSSDDKNLMAYVLQKLKANSGVLNSSIQIVDRIPNTLDAVIATGNNNSFKYFQHYFKNIPHVLRKNRKSLAILDGNETKEEMQLFASDIFSYFGLGCRNVSLFFIPEGFNLIPLIDSFEGFHDLKNHNRYANNYTYHKALFLMNSIEHLDNGFLLIKNELNLHAPLGCIYYSHYKDEAEILKFISEHEQSIQCVVGKNLKLCDVGFGSTQSPNLQDFADQIDTFSFLQEL